jgi:exodeoxyribonuclease VII small subunit
VETLESGELSLEEAIERFEAGRRLHRELFEELEAYEKRIETLDASDADREEPAGGG